jgi:GMP reductase
MMDKDIEKLKQIMEICPTVSAICLDVANGYSEHFVEFVKSVRHQFPEHVIIVSIDQHKSIKTHPI